MKKMNELTEMNELINEFNKEDFSDYPEGGTVIAVCVFGVVTLVLAALAWIVF